MKKIFLIILLLTVSVSSYSQGIEFETGTWEEVLSKAKQIQKPIFVDVYTTWCKPCKKMSNDVFPLAEVGNVYNSNYVCYKIDAEKGDGVQIAKEYEVKGFPTYLFLNPDGSLVMTICGTMTPEDFIALSTSVKKELDSPKPLSEWEKEYAQKKTDTTFLRLYMDKRTLLGKSNAELFDEYLALLPKNQRLSKDIIEIYKRENYNIKINSLAYQNLQDTASIYFLSPYTFMLNAIENSFREAVANKDELLLEKVVEANRKIPRLFEPKRKEDFYMIFYKENNNLEKYISNATAYCDKWLMAVSPDSIAKADKQNLQTFDNTRKNLLATVLDSTELAIYRNYIAHTLRNKYSQELNHTAWYFFEKVTDPEALKNALRWSKRSVDIYPENHTYLDTYANLLYKLGEKNKAMAAGKKALNTAKKAKDETGITTCEETLRKMKAGEKTWE